LLGVEQLEGRCCPSPVPISGVVHAGDVIEVTATAHASDPNEDGESPTENLVITSSGGLAHTVLGYEIPDTFFFVATQDNETLDASFANGDGDETSNVTAAVISPQQPRLSPQQKDAARTLETEKIEDAIWLLRFAAQEPNTEVAKWLTFGAAGGYVNATKLAQLAQDPADTNFQVIAQPLNPPVPQVTAGAGVTQAEADAFNALFANEAQAIGLTGAITTAINRADGAEAAGSSFWVSQQVQAASGFQSQLSSVLNAQVTLLGNLQQALQSGGIPSVTVTPADVMALQSSVAQNGLPAAVTQNLQQLGADSATIAEIQRLVVVADSNAAAGTFPGNLTNPALVSALQGLAGALVRPLSSPSGIGVYESATGQWLLRNELSAGAPDAGNFQYGGPGLIPVTGDWTGTGQTGIGVYVMATGEWLLRSTPTPGAPQFDFFYGGPGLIPVTGNWAGINHTGIGVFDPATGEWLLRNEVSAGAPDAGDFFYGGAGMTPVTGDWTGLGHSGIGVYVRSTGEWLLRNEVSAGGPDAGDFFYGGAGMTPVTGDWTGLGHSGIGVYVNATGEWLLRNEVSAGGPDAGDFFYGGAGLRPVTGSWQSASTPSAARPAALAQPTPLAALDSALTQVGPGTSDADLLLSLVAARRGKNSLWADGSL
jgi:hypothetical protein